MEGWEEITEHKLPARVALVWFASVRVEGWEEITEHKLPARVALVWFASVRVEGWEEITEHKLPAREALVWFASVRGGGMARDNRTQTSRARGTRLVCFSERWRDGKREHRVPKREKEIC